MAMMKRTAYGIGILFLIVALLSCQQVMGVIGLSGNVSLFVTDAKVDQSTVTGVYVTITGVAYNRTDGENMGWNDVEDFGDPVLINLMDFTNGEVDQLHDFTLAAGNYSQLRFYIDAIKKNDTPPPDDELKSYIKFEDGSREPLVVNGDQDGFKAVGGFSVPVSGEVSLIADFDLRKSIVVAGGKYKLKPTIRLLDQSESGSIEGHVYGSGKYDTVIVHAYKKGNYQNKEANDPKKEDPRFPNAESSAKVDSMIDGDDSDDEYVLPFLEPGEYDLIISSYDAEGNFVDVISDPKKQYKDVKVEKKQKAKMNLFL